MYNSKRDLPQPLEDLGGFLNESALVPHFKDYARVIYQQFGDKVKKFITFNEPWVICVLGYETGGNAPGVQEPERGVYECGHNLLKAHAEAYRLYESEFKETQKGLVGITLDAGWIEPEIPENPEYAAAAERALQFKHGWFAKPIFFGTYPQQMIDNVETRLPRYNVKKNSNIS
jgi:beta-glucosidase